MFFRKTAQRTYTKMWDFNQKFPVSGLKDMNLTSFASLTQDFEAKLIERYKMLLEAFASNQVSKIREATEPGLYKALISEMRKLNNSGSYFRLKSNDLGTMKLHNFQLSIGVEIDRSLNYPKEQYSYMGNIDKIKSGLPEDFIKSKNPEMSAWEKELGSMWIFVNPLAPANIIISLFATFTGKAPLGLLKDGKDMILENDKNETHVIRFESEPIRLKTQEAAIISGEFYSMLKLIENPNYEILCRDWIISDIDNFLSGNHFVKKSQSQLS